MEHTRKHDLQELAGTVRDRNTRGYVEEAVAAHLAGAQRSAVVTLWAAIAYDIIQKIRELSTSGEAAAVAFVTNYDDAVRRHDIPALLRIEDQLIEKARHDFEMLQPHEAVALERVREDRHLCAHPAMTADDTLFQPTSELVAAHLLHSITFLLAQQPVQGRSALIRIYGDITAPSFPLDVDSATKLLAGRYLQRAKPSLVRNLTIVLLKKHIGKDAEGDPDAFSIALEATMRTCPGICEATMQDRLPQLAASTTDDKQLLNVLAVASIEPRAWRWCDEATRVKLREIFRRGHLRAHYTTRILRGASGIAELEVVMKEDFDGLDVAQKLRMIELNPRGEYVGFAVSLYASAGGFRSAEAVGERAILPLAPFMSAQDVIDVILAAQGNGQVYYASKTPTVLEALYDATQRHLPSTYDTWKAFVDRMREIEKDPQAHYAYPGIASRLLAYRMGTGKAGAAQVLPT